MTIVQLNSVFDVACTELIFLPKEERLHVEFYAFESQEKNLRGVSEKFTRHGTLHIPIFRLVQEESSS